MKYLPMSILEYRFDENGVTTSVVVQFSRYDGGQTFNVTVELTQDFIHSINPNVDMEKMNKVTADAFARRKIKEWVDVDPPVDPDPTPPEE